VRKNKKYLFLFLSSQKKTHRQVERPRGPQRRSHGLQARGVPHEARRERQQRRREDDGHDTGRVDFERKIRRAREAAGARGSRARSAGPPHGGPVPGRVVDRDLALGLLDVDHPEGGGEEGEAVESQREFVRRGESGGGVCRRGRGGFGPAGAGARGSGSVAGDFGGRRCPLVGGLRQRGADGGRQGGSDVGRDEDGGPGKFFSSFVFEKSEKKKTREKKTRN
jgi:hypothetical protein